MSFALSRSSLHPRLIAFGSTKQFLLAPPREHAFRQGSASGNRQGVQVEASQGCPGQDAIEQKQRRCEQEDNEGEEDAVKERVTGGGGGEAVNGSVRRRVG